MKSSPKSLRLHTSARSVLAKAMQELEASPPPPIDPVSGDFASDWEALRSAEREFESLVAHMTGWERHRWAKAGRPGKDEKSVQIVKAFLELLKETRVP